MFTLFVWPSVARSGVFPSRVWSSSTAVSSSLQPVCKVDTGQWQGDSLAQSTTNQVNQSPASQTVFTLSFGPSYQPSHLSLQTGRVSSQQTPHQSSACTSDQSQIGISTGNADKEHRTVEWCGLTQFWLHFIVTNPIPLLTIQPHSSPVLNCTVLYS